jgi:hypothetical protein
MDEAWAVVRATLDLEGMGGPNGPAGEVVPGDTVWFGAVVVGQWSPIAYVEVHNRGNAPLVVTSIRSGQAQSPSTLVEFTGGTCVDGTQVAPGAMCTIGMRILPTYANFPASATVCLTGVLNCVMLWLRATDDLAGPYRPRPTAIEYYHAGYDHYFVTADLAEIAALDAAAFAGWRRTGGGFGAEAYDYASFVQLAPVCRYYIPMATTSSHFYSANADECAMLPTLYPWFQLESLAAMLVWLPSAQGECVTGTPVYRFWNARHDTNHRLTADAATRQHMLRRGWVPEGAPPSRIALCANSL